jgi:hypothetical protein
MFSKLVEGGSKHLRKEVVVRHVEAASANQKAAEEFVQNGVMCKVLWNDITLIKQ